MQFCAVSLCSGDPFCLPANSKTNVICVSNMLELVSSMLCSTRKIIGSFIVVFGSTSKMFVSTLCLVQAQSKAEIYLEKHN